MMTAQTTIAQPARTDKLLRRALQADGIFEVAFGILFLIASNQVSAFLGWDAPLLIAGAGVVFLIYGLVLLYASFGAHVNRSIVWSAIVVNGLAVLATPFALALVPMSEPGRIALVIMMTDIAILTALEYAGLRRAER